MNLKHKATLLAAVLCAASANAQLVARTGEGDSVKTTLGYNIVLNNLSTLKRQWVAIHDPNSPVEIDGSSNVTVQYEKDYLYATNTTVKAKKDVTAVELVHIIVDVFGRRANTLQNVEVVDLPSGESRGMSGRWRLWSETEAKLAHTSFTYVRSVRMADGKIYFAPMTQVLDLVRKGAPSLTSADIEPKKVEPK